MFARHVTVHIKPDRIDQAVAIFEQAALPRLREQQGFRGGCMLADAESGRGVIMILWEQASDSLRLETAGFYREQIAKFAEVFAEPPAPLLLEVRVCQL
jgi:hypothetical protein